MDGEASHMGLIDDGFRPRYPGRPVLVPIEAITRDDASRHGVRVVLDGKGEVLKGRPRVIAFGFKEIPEGPSGKSGSIRIDQEPVFVESVAFVRFVRAVHPVRIALPGKDPFHPYMPDVARPVVRGVELDRLKGDCVFGRLEEEKAHGRGMATENGELSTVVMKADAVWKWITGIGRMDAPGLL